MGLPEFTSYYSSACHDGQKSGDACAAASEFDSTLEKLSPHLLARLSLHPGGMAGKAGGGGSPGTPGSSSSGPGTPSDAASSGGRRLGSRQHRRRGNRSWAKQTPLPDITAAPGLTRSSVGSLPSPPYSADVDRAFQQRLNLAPKAFGRPRSADSTPGSTPSGRGVPRPLIHESSPLVSSQRLEPPGSHPRPSSHRVLRRHHPRKLLLSDAGQRLLRAGQRAGSDAGSVEGSPPQTRSPAAASASTGPGPGSERPHAACTAAEAKHAVTAARKRTDAASPRLEIHASAGVCVPDGNPGAAAAAAAAAEECHAAEKGDEAQRRLERLRTEKELVDDLATQMALQAQQLVAERADMAARNAELARENAQARKTLMARLEFLEASRGAAAGEGGNAADDGDLQQQQQLEEELGFLHGLLQRAEDEKALLEWQLQQRAENAVELNLQSHGLKG